MSRRVSRRQFLQSSSVAATAAGFWLTGGVSPTVAQNSPNNRLNVAVIGVGGRGEGNVQGVAGENIVALCDCDSNRARNMFNRYPDVPKFDDYRQMFDRVRNIDAVVVATPDHTHAHASIMAMRLGKHCYTEKPLTHDVWEARQMKEIAARQRVATQMGNQGTASTGLRRGVEVIRAGAIGPVRELHVWTNRPIWPQGMTQPATAQPVPEGLNWDVWLGTAPVRPYSGDYVPFKWRGWWDFGTGAIGDMACHTMNMAFMGLSLGAPTAVSATAQQPINDQSPPNGCTIVYEFPARRVEAGNGYAAATELPPVRMTWYERGFPPRELFRGGLREGQNPAGSGSLLIGENGTMYSPDDYGANWRLLPAEQFQNYQDPQPSLPRSPGHHAEWIRACKGGPAALSNFVDYAAKLTEAALLGNVALRAGGRIMWDSENLRVTNNAQANTFIRREYRRGWEI